MMKGGRSLPRNRSTLFRIGVLALFLCLTAVLFLACRGSVCNLLGIETAEYETETVVATVAADGEIADRLLSVIRMMTGDGAGMQAFTGSREAVEAYADRILSYMLRVNYSKYAGNAEGLASASAAYPNLFLTTLIGCGEFDNVIYRYFGGGSDVSHTSSTHFTYLDRVGAYTTMAQPEASDVSVSALKVCETENTYRLSFRNTDAAGDTAEYLAVFVKRTDGSVYLHSLHNA